METLTFSDNLKRLDMRIHSLELRGPVILVFDFDELVVLVHLTKLITRRVSKPVDETVLNNYGHCSFEGIRYLNHLLEGIRYTDYERIRDALAAQTPWRRGFKPLPQMLMKKYSIVFLSSGMKDIAHAKLKEINFPEQNIIGDEFEVYEGRIRGSQLVVSDELKGRVIQKLRQSAKVIAIGHSEGDRCMLQNATVSIGFNAAPGLARYNVRTVQKLRQIIETESKPQ